MYNNPYIPLKNITITYIKKNKRTVKNIEGKPFTFSSFPFKFCNLRVYGLFIKYHIT